MVKAIDILADVSPPDNRTTINVRGAINSDIRQQMYKNFPVALTQAKKFAKKFKRKSAYETAKAVHEFLRKQAYYVRDSSAMQAIRLPNRFLNDTVKKFNSGDCKSFSTFAASVMAANGFKTGFRFAAYRKGAKIPSHVYVIAYDNHGREIIIDGCYPFFNSEKQPTFVQNKLMEVATLSGFEDENDIGRFRVTRGSRTREKLLRAHPKYKLIELRKLALQRFMRKVSPSKRAAIQVKINRLQHLLTKIRNKHGINDELGEEIIIASDIAGRKKKGAKKGGKKKKAKLTPEQKAARRKRRRAKVKAGLKKFGRGVAFITLGVGRGAYLALLALNTNAWANKLKMLEKAGKLQPVLNKWRDLGGLKKVFMKTMNYGAKKKPLWLNKKKKRAYAAMQKNQAVKGWEEEEAIGTPPAAVAAATAIPIIAAIIPVIAKAFGSFGKKKEAQELESDAKDLATKYKKVDAVNFEGQEGSAAENEAEQRQIESGEGEGGEGGEEAPESDAPDEPTDMTDATIDEEQQADEETTKEAVEGLYGYIYDEMEIGKLDGDTWGKLAEVGGKIFGSIKNAITKKIREKKGKGSKAEKVVNQLSQAGDDYFTGQYLRKTGVTAKLKKGNAVYTRVTKAAKNNMLPILLIGGIGLTLVLSRKK